MLSFFSSSVPIFFSWQVKGSLLSVNESFVRTMSYHSLFCHCGCCSTLTMASSSEQTFFLLMDSNLWMFSYGLHVHLTVSHPHDCWDTVPCCCLKTWLLSSSCFRFTHPCGFWFTFIYLVCMLTRVYRCIPVCALVEVSSPLLPCESQVIQPRPGHKRLYPLSSLSGPRWILKNVVETKSCYIAQAGL